MSLRPIFRRLNFGGSGEWGVRHLGHFFRPKIIIILIIFYKIIILIVIMINYDCGRRGWEGWGMGRGRGAFRGGQEGAARKGEGAKPSKSGGPEGGGPGVVGSRTWKNVVPKDGSRRGPKGWGAQNFALFSPLPPQFSFFLPSLGVRLVEFWWCVKRRGPEMFTFGVLGLSCVKSQRPQSRWGFTRQPENKIPHLQGKHNMSQDEHNPYDVQSSQPPALEWHKTTLHEPGRGSSAVKTSNRHNKTCQTHTRP